MADIATLGIVVDSSDVTDATKALADLSTTATKVAGSIKTFIGAWAGWSVIKSIVVESAQLNARFETMGIVMNVVGRNAGYTAQQMSDYELSLRKTGIAMIEARSTLTRMSQAQLDLSKTSQLARVAQDAAVVGGINSSDAFERMVQGIRSGETEILRTIGINVSFQKSYEQTAKELKKNVSQLTEAEKSQSRMNAVLLEGAKLAGVYESAMGTAGKQMQSMKRYIDDLKVMFGEVFNESLTVGVFALSDAFKSANKEMDEMGKDQELKKWGEDLTDIFAALADNISNAWVASKMLGSTVRMPLDQAGSFLNMVPTKEGFEKWKKESGITSKAYEMFMQEAWGKEDRFTKALAARRAAKAKDEAAGKNKLPPIIKPKTTKDAVKDKAVKMSDLDVIDPFGKERNAALKANLAERDKLLRYEYDVEARLIDQWGDDMTAFNALNKQVAEDLGSAIGELFGTDASRTFDAIDKDLTKMRVSLEKLQGSVEPDKYAQMVEAINALASAKYKIADADLVRSQYSKALQEVSSAEASLQSRVITGLVSESQARIDIRNIIGKQGDELEKLIPKLEALMKATDDTNKVAGLQAMIDKIKEMQAIGQQHGWMTGMKSGLNEYSIAVTDTFTTAKEATVQAFQSMETALANFVVRGKMDFSSLRDSILMDIARIQVQQNITRPLAGLMGNIFSMATAPAAAASGMSVGGGTLLSGAGYDYAAKGGVYNSPSLSKWSNQVVDKPTLFAFAKGGIMGEAGPEAIMPLKRGPDGSLGVSGSNVVVNVINNASGVKASKVERTDGSGTKFIDVIIQQIKGDIANDIAQGRGAVPAAIERTYGANRAAGSY